MIKKRSVSVYSDFKTGILCKFFLIIGIILLLIYIVQLFIDSIEISENISGIILAFSILFIGVGIIVYFFNCQFAKLAEIANEVEHGFDKENLEKDNK